MSTETTTEIVTTSDSKAVEYTPLGSRDPIKLSTQLVRKFLAQKTKSGAEASDVECMKFVMLCKVRGLDPWQGDAYLLGYDGKDGPQFTLITAHQAFLKRAEINDKFDGMSSGVVCLDQNGQILEYEGDLVLEDHTLIGGWARVLIKDRKLPIYKRLKLSTFNTGRSRWAADPAGMIVKCFDEQTEVLTTLGFEKFANAEGDILQVTSDGLRRTKSVPFFQPYAGPMVEWSSRNGNFVVTPNHDMPISLNGNLESKMEAGELLRLKQRDKALMPLTMSSGRIDHPISDNTIKLAAAYVSDGSDNSSSSGFSISVSRQDKIAFLKELKSHCSFSVLDDAGKEAVLSSGRVITTRSNKTAFYYSRTNDFSWLVSREKIINHTSLLSLSARQCRLFVDTWMRFDGNKPKSMLLGRIYTSRIDHVKAIDLAAVIAGYSTSPASVRNSEGGGDNYCVAITNRSSIRLSTSMLSEIPNPGTGVWCVKVPSGKIVVRRHGFSSVCHQCAEADALRSAFPTSLGGMYMAEETQSVIDIQSAPQRSSVPLSLTESKSPEKPQKAERKATTPPVETPVAPQPEQKHESPPQEPKREPEPSDQPETPPQSNGNGAPSLPKLQAIMDAGGYIWEHLVELCNTETEPGVFGRRKYIEGAQSLEELTEEQVAGLVARPRGLSAGLRAAKGAA